MREPIAVTGFGLTTCLGIGAETNWKRLREERSGLATVSRFDIGDYPVKEGGEAPAGGPSDTDDGAASFETRHLLGAIREALRGAGFESGRVPDDLRVGVVIGSSLAGSSTSDRFFTEYQAKGPADVDYGLLEGYYIEDLLRFISGEVGARGPAVLVSNACAAGGSSLAQGARWLLGRRADLVIAAGYDPLSIFTFAGFGSLMALSTSTLKPFSANRDGMLLGDGFAAAVLQRLSDTKDRAVDSLLAGYGESTDAHHLTHPHPQGAGAALAMRRALESASLKPEDIDYVNCHGTGTGPNDLAEARALRAVFGARVSEVPLSSSKPFFGHTLGGAGTVEAVVTLLAMQHGFLPANLNLDEIDPEFDDLDVVSTGRAATVRHAMSNSFGFGGSNTSLVFSHRDKERSR